MKFVFALALVAVCVMLMNARPNIKRDTVRVQRDTHGWIRIRSAGDRVDDNEPAYPKEKRITGDREHSGKPPKKSQEAPETEAKILEEESDAKHQKRSIGDRKHSPKQPKKSQEAPETKAKRLEEVSDAEHQKIDAHGNGVQKRATTDPVKVLKWPHTAGQQPVILYKFEVTGGISYGDKEICRDSSGTRKCTKLKELVQQAAKSWNDRSGLNIKLQGSTASTDVITIKSGTGCWSYVGYQRSGNNMIVLQEPDCFQKGVIMHEMAHAFGFLHEAQRADSGNFITIHPEHIKTGFKTQFDSKTGATTIQVPSNNLDANSMKVAKKLNKVLTEYDYCSLMHYSTKAFTKEKSKSTISVKDIFTDTSESYILPCLGAQIDPSLIDGMAMAEMYGRLKITEGCKNAGYMLKGEGCCVCSNLFKGCTCLDAVSDPACGTSEFPMSIGEHKTFKSPGYGGEYPVSTFCEWHFTTPEDYYLCVAFPDGYDIEQPATNGRCAFDWFEIVFSKTQTLSTERYCGNKNQLGIARIFRSNSVVIKLTSDAEYTAKGFHGIVTSVSKSSKPDDCVTKFDEDSEGFGNEGAIENSWYWYYSSV